MRITEERNPLSVNIDQKSTEDILKTINEADKVVHRAVAEAIPDIAEGVELILETIREGGRIFLIGSGTSGRLGVLEASEIPPTFGVSSDIFQAFVSGGPGALFGSVEVSEDNTLTGRMILDDHDFTEKDLLLAISASGRTPFVIGAIQRAKELGSRITTITNNKCSDMEKLSDVSIVLDTGPEIVSGSTRMKAGTAQKMVLNMLTTTVMTKMGRVYDGYMIGVKSSNVKLRERAARIVKELTGLESSKAEELLEIADGDIKTAVVMNLLELEKNEAEKVLLESGGFLRKALEG